VGFWSIYFSSAFAVKLICLQLCVFSQQQQPAPFRWLTSREGLIEQKMHLGCVLRVQRQQVLHGASDAAADLIAARFLDSLSQSRSWHAQPSSSLSVETLIKFATPRSFTMRTKFALVNRSEKCSGWWFPGCNYFASQCTKNL
jgi:hypothetical protein